MSRFVSDGPGEEIVLVLRETAEGLGRALAILAAEDFRLTSTMEALPSDGSWTARQHQGAFTEWLYDMSCEALAWAVADADRLAKTASAVVMLVRIYELRRALLFGLSLPDAANRQAAGGLIADAGIRYGIAAMRVAAERWPPKGGKTEAAVELASLRPSPAWFPSGIEIAQEMRRTDPGKETAAIADAIRADLIDSFPSLPKLGSIETQIGRWEQAGKVMRRRLY